MGPNDVWVSWAMDLWLWGGIGVMACCYGLLVTEPLLTALPLGTDMDASHAMDG